VSLDGCMDTGLGRWMVGLLVGWMFGGMNEEVSVLLDGGMEVWFPGLRMGKGAGRGE